MESYQKRFIDFLVEANALTFGDFVTKSGRKTPYFINMGRFDSGIKIQRLGSFYAQHLIKNNWQDVDIIFGPAYKGVPLAVATASACAAEHNLDIGYTFDRKEVKAHGDGGSYVGKKLEDDLSLVIVEDVITAGTTLREIIPKLNQSAKVNIRGMIIAVDRCERGAGTTSAVQEATEEHSLSISPLVSVHDIVAYLSEENSSGIRLDSNQQESIASYLKEYGA